MVTEKDLQEINRALLDGYEIHIRRTKDGVRIAAEKTTAKLIRGGKQN